MCKLNVLLPLLLTTFFIVKSGLARNEIKWAYKRTIYYLVISFPYPMALQSVTRLLVTIAIYLQLQKMSLRRSSVKTVYLRHSETNGNTHDKHQIPQIPLLIRHLFTTRLSFIVPKIWLGSIIELLRYVDYWAFMYCQLFKLWMKSMVSFVFIKNSQY